MVRINNLRDSLLVRQRRELDKVSRQAVLQSSSVSRGGVRVASAEGLLVEGSQRVTGLLLVDGTLQVTGIESITGTLIVSGAQLVSGESIISGKQTITGEFHIDGETSINGHTNFKGPTDIEGALGLKGIMTVLPGGEIIIEGAIPLRMKDGQMMFGGAMITGGSGSGGGIIITSDNAYARVFAGLVSIGIGDNRIDITTTATAVHGPFIANDDVSFNDLPQKTGTGLLPGLLWRDGTDGEVQVIVS